MVPQNLRYTKEHITDYAAEQLGDVVFVELPEIGRTVSQSAAIGVIESVKAVSDLFAPLSGDVVESNGELADKPELLNSDPFGAGWMLRLQITDASQVDGLLDAAAYDALTAEA
jgi:glycine cleavage system H protein